MLSFRADDFAKKDDIDRSFVRDLELEIAPLRSVPQKERGTKRQNMLMRHALSIR